MSENGRSEVDVATEVFERIMAGEASNGNGHASRPSRVRLTQVRSAAARTLDLYGELFQRAFETYADLAQAALQPDGDPAPWTPLALAGPPGGEAAAPVSIHNQTEVAVAVPLRLTDLTAASGERIAGATFSPPRLDVAPGAGAESLLRVAIPATAAAGAYHGHVLSSALPGVALAVRLDVAP